MLVVLREVTVVEEQVFHGRMMSEGNTHSDDLRIPQSSSIEY